jgi:hypothetical protein
MFEYYTDLTHEQALVLIKDKTIKHHITIPSILRFYTCIHNSPLSTVGWKSQLRARKTGRKIGSFTLYEYTAYVKGKVLYSFFADRDSTPATKQEARIEEDARDALLEFLQNQRAKIKTKYAAMSAKKLNALIEAQGLEKGGSKVDKVGRLTDAFLVDNI